MGIKDKVNDEEHFEINTESLVKSTFRYSKLSHHHLVFSTGIFYIAGKMISKNTVS